MRYQLAFIIVLAVLPFEVTGFAGFCSHIDQLPQTRTAIVAARSITVAEGRLQSLHGASIAKSPVCIRCSTSPSVGRRNTLRNDSTYKTVLSPAYAVALPKAALIHVTLAAMAVTIVRIGRRLLFSPKEDQVQAGGVLDRCPWPFIFFHDPKQGLKDPPTWVTCEAHGLQLFCETYQGRFAIASICNLTLPGYPELAIDDVMQML
eukprot:scaffold3515_cov126-Cylindrotheca_fusiformis.AAC.28